MKRLLKSLLVSLTIISALALLAYESRNHFNKDLIQIKRQHNSAQRNWNIFYGQRHVYYDTAFRYQSDLDQIRKLIEPGHVLLSDLATSYYVAAELPVYVRNVHRHQGRLQSSKWKVLLEEKLACKLNEKKASLAFKDFVYKDREFSKAHGVPKFNYFIVNKDLYNKNVRLDCVWNGRAAFLDTIEKFSTLIFEGEYFKLYQIASSLSATPFEGN